MKEYNILIIINSIYNRRARKSKIILIFNIFILIRDRRRFKKNMI